MIRTLLGKVGHLKLSKPEDNEINFGKVMLSIVTEELAQVTAIVSMKGFIDYIKSQWQQFGYEHLD